MVSYIIEHALIITVDASRRIIKDGGIAIDKEKIVDVGKSDDLARKYQAEITIDASDKVVLPGFIDSHTHVSAEQLVRGLVPDDVSQAEWIQDWIIHVYEAPTEEDEYYSSLHSFIECIKTGTTTICDGGTIHSLPSVVRAMKESGMRGVLGRWSWDVPKKPERMAEDADQIIRNTEETILKFDNSADGRVKVWPMLIGLYPLTCSDELLIRSKELADKHKTGLSMHQSSSKEEVEECIKKTGKRPIEHFEDLGILGNNLRLVHMVYLDDREIELLSRRNVKVVQCPSTALKLGYGTTKFGKLPEMLEKGICVAVGCDGTNSSNFLDMGRAIYLTAGLFKDARINTKLVPAETALEMGTINGAHSILQEDQIGSIEVGKKADIILFDRKRPEWVPLLNPVNTLVYTADGKSVDTVFIDGRMVLEKGKMIGLDEVAIYVKVQELGEKMISRTNLKLKNRWQVE
ncbi:MAG: amidohydrolase [Thaumarchaeota archaeon]|nr:amidohydrolase [Nitrososphaerota archaeon]